MADPIAMVQALGMAVANVSKEIAERSELNNSPAMQSALIVHRVQAALDAERASIQDEDLAAVRLLIAE